MFLRIRSDICLDFLKWCECQHYHPDTFPRKYTGFFLQSITDSQSTHSLLTLLACVWLAGFRPLRLQGMSGQGWLAKKIGTFTEQKATLCDPPHPPGDNAWGLPMVAAGSHVPGLSASTLLDGSPPAFSSTAKASLPAIAGRQAKKFCLKLDTVLKNPDIYNFFELFPLYLLSFTFK